MKKIIIPRGKHVLLKPVPKEARESKFGILAPATEKQEQKCEGTIFSIGPDVKDLKVGDEVIYAKFADQDEIKLIESSNEVDYILIHSDDIKAVWGKK